LSAFGLNSARNGCNVQGLHRPEAQRRQEAEPEHDRLQRAVEPGHRPQSC
jgi:hypothetical protein